MQGGHAASDFSWVRTMNTGVMPRSNGCSERALDQKPKPAAES